MIGQEKETKILEMEKLPYIQNSVFYTDTSFDLG